VLAKAKFRLTVMARMGMTTGSACMVLCTLQLTSSLFQRNNYVTIGALVWVAEYCISFALYVVRLRTWSKVQAAAREMKSDLPREHVIRVMPSASDNLLSTFIQCTHLLRLPLR
jgi:hypothetical protein